MTTFKSIAAEKQIDQLVYKRYGPTPACPELIEGEEIAIVEDKNEI